MPPLIGQPITARELELAASSWPPEQFASMCNALAWAASGRKCPCLPSFTERVNAKDGGIDAEWRVDIPTDDRPISTPILGPGWNVFQYKNRSVIGQDRQRIISNLKSSLKGAIVELVEETGRHPDRYVLFVNVDLKHDQTAALKEAILEGYDRRSEVHVEVAGAATLAALLNDHPHLRSAYFAPQSFKAWELANREHRIHKLFGSDVELIGRERELERFRAWVDDPRVRVIVLSGPHNIGKTRLALEATAHRPLDVVVAFDPRSMALTNYRNLTADHGEVICVVEDPDSEALDRLVDEALTIPNLKLLVTLPTSASAHAPAYGRDERVQALHLQPLGYDDSRKMLKVTGKPLDFEIEDWIIEHAGGVPGILLTAANLSSELRKDTGNFAQRIGTKFEEKIERELGPDALRCARLFSVLTHVGISGEYESELNLVCEVFGDGWTPHHALSALETLEKAGLARRGGSFAEITVPLLANHLLSGLLRGQSDEIFALFGRLEESGSLRFLKRLREVKGPEVEKFWDALFDPQNGLLSSLDSALENAHLLRLIAGTVPERVLGLLELELPEKNLEERLAIAGDQRRELRRTVEQLLFREKTSRGALRLLYLLAEAENESYANNATGVLAECFLPFHPQMPLPLHERLEVLRKNSLSSRRGKHIALDIASYALNPMGHFTVRYSTGTEPLYWNSIVTVRDRANICDYCRDLVKLAFSFVEDPDPEVARTATAELPRLVAEIGVHARVKDALASFEKLVDWALKKKPGLDVSSLINAIYRTRRERSEVANKAECPPERKAELLRNVAELDRLKDRLEGSDFSVRLKRWAGHWTHEGLTDRTAEGNRERRYEKELEMLAQETLGNPGLLNDELMKWLASPSAQRSNAFFFHLGQHDVQAVFRQTIEELGQRPEGNNAFAHYWRGWSERDRESAENRLEELAASNSVTGAAVIQATAWLKPNQATVDRVKAQVQAGRVEPDFVERLLGVGSWIDGLNPNQFEDLIRVIAGSHLEHAPVAVDMLLSRRYSNLPIQGSLADFAWQCLEREPDTQNSMEKWRFDQLTALLAKDDPDRGFRFLETLLLRDNTYHDPHHHWNPIAPYGDHLLWDALHQKDRKRLLGLILRLSRENPLASVHISWGMPVLLNLESDRDILLCLANDDVEMARTIASFVTRDKDGFWPLAFGLLKLYPSDEILRANLEAGIVRHSGWIAGSMSQYYDGIRRELEQLLQAPETPPEEHSWLRRITDSLKEEVTSRVVWEYDLDVNDLRRFIKDKESPQRLWAIGRVLKYGDWKTVKKLLTPEDIAEALPQVDLPEQKRKALERAVEFWLHDK